MFKNKQLIINLHRELFSLTGKLINAVSRANDFTAEEFGHTDQEFKLPEIAVYDKHSANELLEICGDLVLKCQYMVQYEHALDTLTDDEFDQTTFILKVANDILGFKIYTTKRLIKYFTISSVRFGHLVDTVEGTYERLLN